MRKVELLLKTGLCCMACDGNIAQEEIELLNNVLVSNPLFKSIDTAELLQEYTHCLSTTGMRFVNEYLSDLALANLSADDALELIQVAFSIIEADNEIEYAEVAFFKKIRQCLAVSDEQILAKWPDKEDFLLPDIMDKMPLDFDFSGVNFCEILKQ
jgi:uncharacterized tellurite resistance protein B-like protein